MVIDSLDLLSAGHIQLGLRQQAFGCVAACAAGEHRARGDTAREGARRERESAEARESATERLCEIYEALEELDAEAEGLRRHRVEAILDALFVNPGPVDGVIDDRTSAAIGLYAAEYGFAGEAVLSAELLQHLETEARAMGVLDLIK